MRQLLKRVLPERVRSWWWWLSDSAYRREFRSGQRRGAERRAAQMEALPAIQNFARGKVVAGPFAGMSYVDSWDGVAFTQKHLGTYEKELWPIIEEIGRRKTYRSIIDIGAADGYYACGLTRRLPLARTSAFEAQPALHALLLENARCNEVRDRIDVLGLCTHETLAPRLSTGSDCFLLCDAEGAELHLLDPAVLAGLASADLLVETHDGIQPGISDALKLRFDATHQIRFIASSPRTMADLPIGLVLSERLALAAMDEARNPSTNWLWMVSRRRSI